ncbi:conserved exported hypothetical protein [Tenacibaculum maritimum]|uniref:toxin-antitoxin system YwqK family antitoxin n=1 Tax=Tenacibaculum maritimum TaxID=107401 RepID=UPI0012E52B48|nr:hypothetical protein [Tenacibaculum maritimum]CAA0172843.1 conserved exported hypothetical protein [Tenacibaculum maritimum]
MKNSKTLIRIILFFLAITVNAQETIWFDANWNATTKDKAVFYRPAPQKKGNGFWIVDYYINGTVQMEGFSTVSTPNEEKFDGLILYYHPNGKTFHKANYQNGELEGKRDVYYETGELKETGKYTNGKRDGVWKTYYKNGKIKKKGKYRNGEKIGVWKTFYKNVY